MANGGDMWYTTTGTNSTSNLNYTITATGGGGGAAGGGGYGGVTYVWPPATIQKKEDVHMDKCHLCGAEIEQIDVQEWREDISKKKDKDSEWEWYKTTEKKFACGTVKREGDWDKVIKRVTLGQQCVDLG